MTRRELPGGARRVSVVPWARCRAAIVCRAATPALARWVTPDRSTVSGTVPPRERYSSSCRSRSAVAASTGPANATTPSASTMDSSAAGSGGAIGPGTAAPRSAAGRVTRCRSVATVPLPERLRSSSSTSCVDRARPRPRSETRRGSRQAPGPATVTSTTPVGVRRAVMATVAARRCVLDRVRGGSPTACCSENTSSPVTSAVSSQAANVLRSPPRRVRSAGIAVRIGSIGAVRCTASSVMSSRCPVPRTSSSTAWVQTRSAGVCSGACRARPATASAATRASSSEAAATVRPGRSMMPSLYSSSRSPSSSAAVATGKPPPVPSGPAPDGLRKRGSPSAVTSSGGGWPAVQSRRCRPGCPAPRRRRSRPGRRAPAGRTGRRRRAPRPARRRRRGGPGARPGAGPSRPTR